MPHSSGGGSHGGGSHGGSHGSRGSSGFSSRPYPGARRYRYMHHGRPRYVYSRSDPSKAASPLRFLLILFYIPFLAAIFVPMKTGINSYRNLTTPATDQIIIDDQADLLGNTDKLEKSLEKFQKKTNITPAVISVDFSKTLESDSVNTNSNTLENLAMSEYLQRFPGDEMHWLIAYTADPEDPVNFYFEGIQGDYTDPVITEAVANSFNSDLYKELERSYAARPADSIAAVFDSTTDIVKKPSAKILLSNSVPMLFYLAFILFHAYVMIFSGRKYKNAVLDEETVPTANAASGTQTASERASSNAVTCTSCGSMFPKTSLKCTVCGAFNPILTGKADSTSYQASSFDTSQTTYSAQPEPSVSDSTHGMMPDAYADTKLCPSCGAQYSASEGKCPICGAR